MRTGMTTIGIPARRAASRRRTRRWPRCSSRRATPPRSSARTTWATATSSCRPVHGFDEWFGNLYHLNAEEEPEELDYPGQKNPEYPKKFGPRGVLHAWATDKDDPTDDGDLRQASASRRSRTPACSPASAWRPSTSEVLDQTLDWLDSVGKGDKPFFCWFNTTAIHIFSHPQKKYVQKAVDEGRAEEDVVRAKMIEHDEQVGALLQSSRSSASPTTRSSSTRPTTATS